jgi:hypothetical protein
MTSQPPTPTFDDPESEHADAPYELDLEVELVLVEAFADSTLDDDDDSGTPVDEIDDEITERYTWSEHPDPAA